jgi:hypothetical protein
MPSVHVSGTTDVVAEIFAASMLPNAPSTNGTEDRWQYIRAIKSAVPNWTRLERL